MSRDSINKWITEIGVYIYICVSACVFEVFNESINLLGCV